MKIKNRMADILEQYPYDTGLQQEYIEREWYNMREKEAEIIRFARANRCKPKKGVHAFKLDFKNTFEIHSIVTITGGCCDTHRTELEKFIENSDYHFLS